MKKDIDTLCKNRNRRNEPLRLQNFSCLKGRCTVFYIVAGLYRIVEFCFQILVEEELGIEIRKYVILTILT